MMNRRQFITAGLGATAGVAAIAATGCSGGSGNGSAAGSGSASAAGEVYYLNFKPEQDAQWQELAELYTEETGVPVTVKTAASGQYETTLKSEMAKSEAPTLFPVNGPVGLASWTDYCLDLDDADVMTTLTDDSYALKGEDGKTKGVAYVIESYGLIYNKSLLDQAGYSEADITNFDSLKKVVEDMNKHKDDLGI